MQKSYKIAAFVALISALWIFSGFILPTPKADDSDASDLPQKIVEVRVREMKAQPMINDVLVTGQTQASRTVSLKAETDGQVIEVLAEKGMAVEEGQVIAKLEIRDRAARVAEAEQLVNQRQIQFNASKELEGKGFNSKVRLAESRAQLEGARAQLEEARTELEKIHIKAPYDGVISNQFIEIGDFLSKGDDVFEIVDLDPIEIVGFLTERQVVDVRDGAQASAKFLNDQLVSGQLSYIAPAADSQTRTFRIEISADNPGNTIKDGLTTEIKIPVRSQQAYQISPSILSLADDGTVGVKAVDENDTIRFYPVTMIMDTPEFLWVGGLPDKLRIVTVGQDFVVPGQKVRPVLAQGGGLL